MSPSLPGVVPRSVVPRRCAPYPVRRVLFKLGAVLAPLLYGCISAKPVPTEPVPIELPYAGLARGLGTRLPHYQPAGADRVHRDAPPGTALRLVLRPGGALWANRSLLDDGLPLRIDAPGNEPDGALAAALRDWAAGVSTAILLADHRLPLVDVLAVQRAASEAGLEVSLALLPAPPERITGEAPPDPWEGPVGLRPPLEPAPPDSGVALPLDVLYGVAMEQLSPALEAEDRSGIRLCPEDADDTADAGQPQSASTWCIP